MIKSFENNNSLGALSALLSPHLKSKEVLDELDRFPSQAIVGLGQGGGRIATELSRFGFPTFLLNSSKSDMEEHKRLISEDRRIVTKSKLYPELEGTDKNAQLGYDIATENKELYKMVALTPEIQNAEFVWATVSLGGGTGNGALKVALAYLSAVRKKRALPDGNIPLGIICSLPSSDEKGSSFRKNALAGVAVIQQLMNERKIGNVLIIDNEKIKNYYAKDPLKTYNGTEIDAKSYSNMVVASILAEISSLPLLDGRSVFDKTELLATLSTPGWLSISKNNKVSEIDNLEHTIHDLFNDSEVLAEYELSNIAAGAIAVMYPSGKNISPKIADDVYQYTSNLLNTKVNLSISTNSKVENLTFYGLTVNHTPSVRITQLKEELTEWIKLEEEQERAKQEASSSLGLDEFADFFSSERKNHKGRGEISLSDLNELDNTFELGEVSFKENDSKNEKSMEEELDDLDI